MSDSKQIILENLQPKQIEFCRAKNRYIAFGGARGGGKSFAVREKAARLAIAYPGIKILIIRKQLADLRENHIDYLRAKLEVPGFARYKEKEKRLICVNNSTISFNYFANDNDALQYQGLEYDIIFLEEATQFSEVVYDTLKACLRGANKFPKRMYFTCNPGGVGHAWIKRLFIDRDFKKGENPNDYLFIKSLVYDNKILTEQNPEYVKQLETLPDSLKAAWLNGSWDVFDGRFFPEFNREVHVVEPFEIPADWKIYRAFDYGLDMFACLWIAMDYNNHAYVFREFNESNLIVSDAVAKMKELTGEKIYLTIAPGDLNNRHSDTGKSTLDIFQENGVFTSIADNRRIQGWLDLKEWLKVYVNEYSEFDANLKIFSTCPRLIKNICELQFDQKRINDAATEPHDITHNTDALRYFCAGRPVSAIKDYTPKGEKLINLLKKGKVWTTRTI